MFLYNLYPTASLHLYMTTTTAEEVKVSITTPKWNSMDAVDIIVTVTNNNLTLVDLPQTLQLLGTVKDTKLVRVVAEEDIILYCGNQWVYSGDSYIAYPVKLLGRMYVIATFEDEPDSYLPVFGVATIHDDTEININFTKTVRFILDGVAYIGSIMINLQQYQVLQIVNQNISGTIVTSDKDIVVNSGHVALKVPLDAHSKDHIEEQLLPVDYWANDYFYVSSQNENNVTDRVRIYGFKDQTNIVIDNGTVSTSLEISTPGGFLDVQVQGHCARITNDQPVQIAQTGFSIKSINWNPSQNESAATSVLGDPFLYIITGISQFYESFTFLTPIVGTSGCFTNFVTLIANYMAVGDLELDGGVISPVWTEFTQSEYIFTQISITEGVHTARLLSKGGIIGGMVYGSSTYAKYGTSIGKYIPQDNENVKVRYIGWGYDYKKF